jgi:hypothetical protein
MKKAPLLGMMAMVIIAMMQAPASAMTPAPLSPIFAFDDDDDDDDGGSGVPVVGPIIDGVGGILGGIGHILDKTGDGVGDVLGGVGDAVGGGVTVGDDGIIKVGGGDGPPVPEPPPVVEVDKWEKALDRIADQIDKVLGSGVPPESLGSLLDKLLDSQDDIIEAKADADGSGDDGGDSDGSGS